MKHRLLTSLMMAALATATPWNPLHAALPAPIAKPNIIFFLADDFG
jgi:hypothetical protein